MIAGVVAQEGRVRLADLVELLGVTEPTIRKDLDELQQRGVLRRTHGGAISAHGLHEVPIRRRTEHHHAAKQAIARACVAEIRDGESVFLDSGTTVYEIAAALDRRDVNVLTNALAVATLLADRTGVRHTLVGGQIRTLGGSVVGPIALDNLSRFHVDVAFIGASGFTADGISVADVAEAQIKQSVISRARRVVVPLDASKFGVSDFVQVCDLSQIDVLVTDHLTDQAAHWCKSHDITTRSTDSEPRG